MTHYNPGDIVLVRFPFTDMSSGKRRPAVVLSPVEFQKLRQDIVIMALTSQPQPMDDLLLTRWREAGLPKKTWAKPLLGTISGLLIERGLGVLHHDDYKNVTAALTMMISSCFMS